MSVYVIGRGPQVVDLVVGAVRASGVEAAGAPTDEAALAALADGGVELLVIGGGVEEPSRVRLRADAKERGVTVVEAPLRGRALQDYVQTEIIDRLAGRT
ncbi:hypothetical protein [Actinomadura atramentaria]|uniref:hypothetical protein n=1 Tax=Actinomadura atramentaria TaxID=1990 RepID=UPI00037B2AA1|nr:hypothetical protein [Actinomadura atramentaria]